MLAFGTLTSGLRKVYERKAGEVPDVMRWLNKSAGPVNITVSAGPDGAVEIDQGTIGAGEPAETVLRGVLKVGEVVKVDCDTGAAIDFCVTEVS